MGCDQSIGKGKIKFYATQQTLLSYSVHMHNHLRPRPLWQRLVYVGLNLGGFVTSIPHSIETTVPPEPSISLSPTTFKEHLHMNSTHKCVKAQVRDLTQG